MFPQLYELAFLVSICILIAYKWKFLFNNVQPCSIILLSYSITFVLVTKYFRWYLFVLQYNLKQWLSFDFMLSCNFNTNSVICSLSCFGTYFLFLVHSSSDSSYCFTSHIIHRPKRKAIASFTRDWSNSLFLFTRTVKTFKNITSRYFYLLWYRVR